MRAYIIAGANMFGQWFTDELIVEGFTRVKNKHGNFDLDKAKLVQANWSYNIFEAKRVFYISGLWGSLPKQLEIVPFPIDFPKDSTTTLMAGNDNYIHIIDVKKQEVYVIDLKFQERIKKVILTKRCEDDNVPRRIKRTNKVMKAMMMKNAGILMRCVNREVKIYMGLYPHHVKTEHVMGRIIDVQCGYEHYMLLTDTGKVYTWGNGRRQLGHGGIENVQKPLEVRALAGFNIKMIRAGGWHSAVVTELGNLFVWGWNDVGQLGVKSLALRRRELQEGPLKQHKKYFSILKSVNIYDEELNRVTLNVTDVSCGLKHTVIMLSDYSIWAAGCNRYGQLGLPLLDFDQCEHFVKVYKGTKRTVLRCGPQTSVIVK